MANIRSFKELRVWRNAMDAAMRVFELSKRFPTEDKYSLMGQFRRSSRSVAANVAEAWRKRRYRPAFVARLNDAESEAAETQTWIEFASRCGFLSQADDDQLDQLVEQILGQLVSMTNHPDQWTLPASPRPRVSQSPPQVEKGEAE
jgi:four helix bundle protein